MSDKNWTHDEPLRQMAEKFIADNDLTHAEFAAKLGGRFSPTRVTKYLNLDKSGNAAEPDAPRVEAAIRALLRHVARGKNFRESLFDNSVSRNVADVFRQIRKTGDIGVIHGDGGRGKTCGAILFCRDNPNSLFTTARKPYACSDWALLNMLLEEFLESSDEKWDGTNKGLWLEKRLRGTERLWIIDDAELLDISAVKLAISIHDATGIPLAFIGNDEFVDKIRTADKSGKMISRIGIKQHVRMGDDAAETARKLIQQFAPASNGELVEVVTDVIGKFGHARRARKQLILAANLHEGSRDKNWALAFAAAGQKLVNPDQQRRVS